MTAADAATPTVRAGDAVFSFLEAGSGEALVLLHGIGSAAVSFRPQLEGLSTRLRVIAWDAPGYGASTPLAMTHPEAGDYAAALHAWFGALGIERCHLVGHSLGTLIAARFAAEHPDSVVGLTLASIAKGHGRLSQSERQRLLAQRLDDVASLGPRGMAAKRGPRLLGREATEEMRHMVVETMARIRPEGYAQAARMLSAGDILADLARLPAGLPMQVIVGEADAITLPGACLEIAAAFAAPAHIISGAGHALYLEKAQEFNRLLSDFALARRDYNSPMRVEDFHFELPRARIASHPCEPRDAARLLFIPAAGRFQDWLIADLPALLRPGDLLVFNDTKVIPARLIGRRGEAVVEVTLYRDLGGGSWRAFAKGVRRLRAGDNIVFGDGFTAVVAEKHPEGDLSLRFDLPTEAFREALARHGSMPLPPYIRRPRGGDARDRHDYQTIFARAEGAVAAPTAGLHFTPALLDALARRGVRWTTLTLHVGPGTFLPVKVDDPRDHRMHAEWGVLPAETAENIAAARRAGGRVVAVGTTSLRLLETATAETGEVRPFAGETRLFILPGYRFRAIDMLLTNFHLPRSTLLMLVAALAGRGRIKSAYAHAVARGYRFYSYGDACLIERPVPPP